MRPIQCKRSALKPSLAKQDKEGVASVVGTILALIVFLSLLGIFTNHYVPSIMTGNERQHDNSVISQLSQLKQSIDELMVYYSGSHSNTLSSYSSVTLGSGGVPMFAQATQGQMNVIPQYVSNSKFQEPYFSVSFNYIFDGNTLHVNSVSGGGVVVNLPNRYYIPQSVLYENDAVIVGQAGGQVMPANPGFIVSGKGGVHLTVLQLSILTPSGANMTYSGTSTIGLNVRLTGLTNQSYSVSPGSSVQFGIGTPYTQAWQTFFNSSFEQAGLADPAYTPNSQFLGVSIAGVNTITLVTAVVTISAEG